MLITRTKAKVAVVAVVVVVAKKIIFIKMKIASLAIESCQ